MSDQAPDVLAIEGLDIVRDSATGPVPLLRDVSLRVRPRERVGLVGESGSGKSLTCLATMRLLPGGLRRTGGTVSFQGEDVGTMRTRRLNRLRGTAMSMIYQEPLTSLNPLMRVGRQIAEGQPRDLTGRAAVESALERVGIPDPRRVARSFPHELSGGMRQRVMIAMATIGRPALLIADEPTTALDVTIQSQVLQVMYDVSEQFGTAVLMVSHDLNAVRRLVDRIVVMYAGRVVEDGPVDRVLTAPSHPYTAALIASAPSVRPRQERLPVIPGSVPQPGQWPGGCHFAPRCSRRLERCDQEHPAAVPVGAEHTSACWLAETGASR